MQERRGKIGDRRDLGEERAESWSGEDSFPTFNLFIYITCTVYYYPHVFQKQIILLQFYKSVMREEDEIYNIFFIHDFGCST